MTAHNTNIMSDRFITEINAIIRETEQTVYNSLLNERIKDTRISSDPRVSFVETDFPINLAYGVGEEITKRDKSKRIDDSDPREYGMAHKKDYRTIKTVNIPVLDRIILSGQASDAEITNGVLDCAKQTWENDLWYHKYYNNGKREGYVPKTIIGLVIQPPKDSAQLFDNNPEEHMNLTRMEITPLDDEFKNGIYLETTSTSVLKPRGIHSERNVRRGGAPDKQLAEIIRNGHGFIGDAYNQAINDVIGFSLTNGNYPLDDIRSNGVPAEIADRIYYNAANNMNKISDGLMDKINVKLGKEIGRETYYSSIGHAADRLKEDGHWPGVEPMDWRKTLQGICRH